MNNFFPPFIRYNYNNPYYYMKKNTKDYISEKKNISNDENEQKKSIFKTAPASENTNDTCAKISNDDTTRNANNKPLLELYGIKLYDDDLLILLLIYFLYKENSNDKLLMLVLFSLLF